MEAISITVFVWILKPKTKAKTIIIATNEAGTALDILGKSSTIAIVKATKPNMINSGFPESQTV
ncbi:hypothetical protein D3C80_1359840 [compost metagenome]